MPHPLRSTLLIVLAAAVALTVVFLGLGFLLTDVVLHGSTGRWDEHAEVWLAAHRTPWLNQVTRFISWLADAPRIIAVAGPVSAVLAVQRRWRDVLILVIGLPLELAVFLSVTFPVDRPRPSVPKLNAEPATGSFPSGHIVATIVLYAGIVVILHPRVHAAAGRAMLWMFAIGLPLAVGFARAYRGMHHPTDVAAGAVLGVACLVVAVRAADRATEPEAPARQPGDEAMVPVAA